MSIQGNDESLICKVAVITGASSGIGEAAALKFHEAGYKIVLAGRDEIRAKKLRERITQSKVWIGDLQKASACNDLIDFAFSQWGRIDVLINCAGIIFRKNAEDTKLDEWDQTLAINLSAPFHLSRAVIPYLKQSSGVIINIASDWGLKGGELAAAYCASKGGLVLLTKAMALDHARDKIRINAICPGDVDTPMLKYEAEQSGVDYSKAMRDNNTDSPTGRVTLPIEVASLCLYLASIEAAQITGAAIPIDGGNTA